MAGKRGSANVAPQIRGAFTRALMIVEGSKKNNQYSGMSLSEIFADMIENGEVKTAIELVARFTPNEMLIGGEVNHKIGLDPGQLNMDAMKLAIQNRRERDITPAD